MKNLKHLFIFTLLLIGYHSINAQAVRHVGNGYLTYSLDSNKEITDEEPFFSDVSYDIFIDLDRDTMSVFIANDLLYEYHIYSKTKITKPGKGVFLECSRGITFQIYTDKKRQEHILLIAPKCITVFDIKD